MNQPSSSRFPTNGCYIYDLYIFNNVSFMAVISFQVNFIRATHGNSKNEIEKQYLQQHFSTEKRSVAISYNREHVLLKKLILQNNDKSSETHYRLIVINGVYATRHVTHSIIY